DTSESIGEAVKGFIARYKEDKREFPDMVAHYTASIESEKTHDSENLISIRMFTHLYTGGAHGYSSVSYLNFDPKTGNEIAIEQIQTDRREIIRIIEIKVRRATYMPQRSDLSTCRRMSEVNAFILPTSKGFEAKHMLVTYNPYETPPYTEVL